MQIKMKHHYCGHRNVILIKILIIFVSIISSHSKICDSMECKQAARYLKNSIDAKSKPCWNFHEYACSNWPKSHSPYSNLSQLRKHQYEAEILEFFRKENNDTNEPEAVKKAKQLFSLCLHNESFKIGENFLNEILKTITDDRKRIILNNDYSTAVAKATRSVGVHIFFEVIVRPVPYNPVENMIWIQKPSRSELLHGVKEDSNTKQDDALKQSFNDYLKIVEEKQIEPIQTVLTLQDLHTISHMVAERVHLFVPEFNWTRYIEEIFSGLENVKLNLSNRGEFYIAIDDLNFIERMLEFIYKQNMEKIEYIIRQEVKNTLKMYAGDIKSEQFSQFHHINRAQLCIKVVSPLFKMALSYIYIRNDTYNDVRFEIYDIFVHVQESFRKMIDEALWMDKHTKERSLKKLASMKCLIAYTKAAKLLLDIDNHYKKVNITDDMLKTVITLNRNEIRNNFRTLAQKNNVTEERWISSLSSMNVIYLPQKNTITIPASILRIPYFYSDALKALNYGSIGFLIAHEMIRGFDELGRQYNEQGSIEDWWTEESLQRYNRKTKCFKDTYGNYSTVENGNHEEANNTLTLNEDILDNGGFKIVLLAYRNYTFENGRENLLTQFEEFTHEQLFTIGFSSIFCGNSNGDVLKNQWNRSNSARLNNVVMNSEEFSKIWKCFRGNPMNPNQEKCSVW